MSESATPAATMTQPSPATRGLQGYDLEGQKKRGRFRGIAFAIPFGGRKPLRGKPNHATTASPQLHKDSHPMRDIIAEMTGALSQSVSDLVASNPHNLQQELAKNFSEFQAALEEEIDADLSKRDPDGDLFKGMGTVGRMVRLAHHVHREAKHIREGKDYEGATPDDDCPDHVSDMLDHMCMAADIGMHHAVNDHVGMADENEQMPPGMTMVHIPTRDGHMVAKTALPDDLIKFIIDPAQIEEAEMTLGASFLLKAGIEEGALEKAFTANGLAKAGAPFPPKKKTAAADAGEDDEPSDDGASDGNDRTGVDGGAPTGDGSDASGGDGVSDGSDMDNPFSVLGRLLAACMIQLSYCEEAAGMDPQDDGSQDTMDGADPSASAGSPMQNAAPTGGLRKSVTDGELAKLVSDAASKRVEAELADLRPMLEKLLSQPEPAKAFVGSATSLSKSEDTGGADAVSDEERLAKMSPEQRAHELTKMAFRRPAPRTGG